MADAFAAYENARARDEPYATLTLQVAAERAFRPVPFDLVALPLASEDHPAATFSFSFSPSFSFALSLSVVLIGVRMMSSINPYSLAASDVRK
jgi:hypothetical protein